MEIVKTLVVVLNVLSAFAIIVLVLMQHGKGADAGATFGSGSGSAAGLFGAAGSANFLSRATALCAVVFFATCLGLALLSSQATQDLGVMSGGASVVDVEAPPAAQNVDSGTEIKSESNEAVKKVIPE